MPRCSPPAVLFLCLLCVSLTLWGTHLYAASDRPQGDGAPSISLITIVAPGASPLPPATPAQAHTEADPLRLHDSNATAAPLDGPGLSNEKPPSQLTPIPPKSQPPPTAAATSMGISLPPPSPQQYLPSTHKCWPHIKGGSPDLRAAGPLRSVVFAAVQTLNARLCMAPRVPPKYCPKVAAMTGRRSRRCMQCLPISQTTSAAPLQHHRQLTAALGNGLSLTTSFFFLEVSADSGGFCRLCKISYVPPQNAPPVTTNIKSLSLLPPPPSLPPLPACLPSSLSHSLAPFLQ